MPIPTSAAPHSTLSVALPSRERLAQTVADLCAFGEKVSGTPEEKAACDYLVSQLKKLGIEHQVIEFDAYISHPTQTELSVLGSAGRDIPAVGLAFVGSTPAHGISAEVVFAGHGAPADYDGLDVHGKIVLVDRIPGYGNCIAAQQRGALGLIGTSYGPQRHKMACSPVWGSPANQEEVDSIPTIAAASISLPDGIFLRELLAKQSVKVLLKTTVDTRWRKVLLPVADIAGTEPEFLLMGAHYCTWFDGATDNIGADAILLEMARLFHEAEKKPRYGLRFAWWPGHTQGRYAGSAWYADNFWHELHEHAIGYLNIDINGSRRAVHKALRNQMGEIADYTEHTLAQVQGEMSEAERRHIHSCLHRSEHHVNRTRPHRASDQSFWGIGLTSLQMSSFMGKDDPDRLPNSGLARWWHAAEDSVQSCDPEVLTADARVHAHLIDGIVNAALLPMNLRQTASDMRDALRDYDEAINDESILSGIHAHIDRFDQAAAQFHQGDLGLGADDRARSAERNRGVLRVARCVNPVLYQNRGPFQQDPAKGSRLFPGLSILLRWTSLSADEKCLARVALRRESNRIEHALKQATALLNNTPKN